jgi:hypothetical protein
VIPFWHEVLHNAKTQRFDPDQVNLMAIPRYGHCTFTGFEVLTAFVYPVERVTGTQPAGYVPQFSLEQAQPDCAAASDMLQAPRDQ